MVNLKYVIFLMLILALGTFCDDVEAQDQVKDNEEVYHTEPDYDEKSKFLFLIFFILSKKIKKIPFLLKQLQILFHLNGNIA